MRFLCLVLPALLLAACGGGQWTPRHDWPVPPRTQSYAEPGQCRGGSRLAALETPLPDYPALAFRRGLQGWVLILLDVGESGATQNVRVLRDAPDGAFVGPARRAVEDWRFAPPEAPLADCLVRIDFRAGKVSISG